MDNLYGEFMPLLSDLKKAKELVDEELEKNETFLSLKENIKGGNRYLLHSLFRDIFLSGYITGWKDSDNFNMLRNELRIKMSREGHNG